ncbi:uncharacterized protein DS421_9g265150 [Arachis hypogaea]|nr:uncharacterized protein DS421_9g265150 [Arachis hypogaea]
MIHTKNQDSSSPFPNFVPSPTIISSITSSTLLPPLPPETFTSSPLTLHSFSSPSSEKIVATNFR